MLSDFIGSNFKYLPPGVGIDVSMTRADPRVVIMSPITNRGYQLHITDIKLRIRRVRLTAGVQEGLLSRMRREAALFPYTTMKPHVFEIAAGSSTARVTPPWNSVPRRCFMYFVKTTAVNPGQYPENCRILANINISQVHRNLELIFNHAEH